MNRRDLLILAGGVLLSLASVAITASATLASTAPDLALALWPASSAAAARKAELLSTARQDDRLGEARQLAMRALLRQPLEATAARTLGVIAARQGREQDTERLLALAEWLSRRDSPTQMALIETQISRGNIVGALIHYDRAMRTSLPSRAILLPVLVTAADDPGIAPHLAALLRGRPWWWQDFYDRYSQVGADPASLARIATALDFRPAAPADAERLSVAINRLVGLGDIGRARLLYARARPEAGAGATLRDGGFENDAPLPPWEWAYTATDERAGIREWREGASGKVALSLTGTVAGPVARQLLTLAPGRYMLSLTLGETGADAAARPSVTLACVGAGSAAARMLTSAGLPAATRATAWRMPVAIPRDSCRAQWLEIHIGANLDAASTAPWIDNVRIDHAS